MKLAVSAELMAQIHAHAEESYPNEGAGFLLGRYQGSTRVVLGVLPAQNERRGEEARRRYLIRPEDMLRAETEASRRGLDLVGIFHSHPDHPSQPSETDREWALPWLSYLITSVKKGQAGESRSWRLAEDRSRFDEEELIQEDSKSSKEE